MNFNQCHASKDFIRTVQMSTQDLIYSRSMIKERESILRLFSLEIIPILRLSCELSDSLLKYSEYEALKRIARSIEKDCRSQISDIMHAVKYCPHNSSEDDLRDYISASNRIWERMIEDMQMTDISERLGCDYLRYMICLYEGTVRLAENALKYETCSAALRSIGSISKNGREQLHSMRKILAVIE